MIPAQNFTLNAFKCHGPHTFNDSHIADMKNLQEEAEKQELEELKQKMNEIAEILKPDLKESMKIQMTPWKEAHKVRMEDLYTRLRIEKHTIEPQKTEKEEVNTYEDLFRNLNQNKRILIKGNPGIGKTTFSRKIVFDWANNDVNDSELRSIVLMFLVTLKYINANQSIEDMIKQQHKSLAPKKDITVELLRDILEKCGQECLVILEGYDEIPKDINENIEVIVKNKAYRDCHFLITSRPNEVESIEDCMASIASIEGFSKENTRKYIEKVIKDKTKWQAVYQYTENSAIEEMWRYPILVLFLCLLVNWGAVDLDKEKLMVGEFYKRLLNCIYRRFVAEKIDEGKQEEEEKKRENTLLKIGNIAFKGLLSNKVTYRKREILKSVGPNAFQYGILIGTDEWEGRRDMPENADIFVYFVHKSIQEYLAAKYFMNQLLNGRSIDSLIPEKRANLEFVKNNLLFFTFCGYFTKKIDSQDLDTDIESDEDEDKPAVTKNVTSEEVKEQLLGFMAKCLDVKTLKLEGVAIYEESSWLFLEALPKCSQIEELLLKDMRIKVSLSFLLQAISKSLKHLHIDSCTLTNTKDAENKGITFPELKTMKFSGKGGSTHMLKISAWKAVEILDLKEYDINEEDVKDIAEANKSGQLTSVKEIRMEGNKTISGHVNVLLAGTWPKLQILTMNKCGLSKADIEAIAAAKQKGFLPSIDLTVTSLSSGNVDVVPVMCGAWKLQENLDLRKCNEEGIRIIAEANRLDLLTSVKEIDFTMNKCLSGHVSTLLSNRWPLLKKLTIEKCDLIKDDILAIHEANEKGLLTNIDLTNCWIHYENIPIVPVMCGGAREVETIDIRSGDKQDVITIVEANGCGLLPSAKVFMFFEQVFSHISNPFSHPWKSLETIHMSKRCSKEVISVISEANRLGYLPSMKSMSLGESISGKLDKLLLNNAWITLEKLRGDFTRDDIKSLGEANNKGLLPSILELYFFINLSGQVGGLMCSKWQALRMLHLSDADLTAEDVRALGDANRKDYLPNLRVLDLSKNGNVSGELDTLLLSIWPLLTTLELAGCNLTKNDMTVIYKACKKGFLPSIDLKVTLYNPFIYVVPAMCGAWKSEERLFLGRCMSSSQDVIAIGEACRCGQLSSVREIDLYSNKNISSKIENSLCTGEWSKLETLKFGDCNLTIEDIEALGEASLRGYFPSLQELKELDKNENVLHHAGLVLCGKWPALQVLDLSQLKLSPEDIRVLGEANSKGHYPCLKELKILNQHGNLAGHIEGLVCGKWPSLQVLALSQLKLTPKDIRVLGEANSKGYFPSLKMVYLDNNDISDLLNLLFNSIWPAITVIELNNCNLTRDDVSAIHEAHGKGHIPNIDLTYKSYKSCKHWHGHDIPVVPVMCGAWDLFESIDLGTNYQGCILSEQNLITIIEAKRYDLLSSVKELNLQGYTIAATKIDALLFGTWQYLQVLNLSGISTTADDIRAVGQANSKGHLPNLKVLELRGCKISGQLHALLHSKWPVLSTLDVYNCDLTKDDFSAIYEAYKKGFLPSIDQNVRIENCMRIVPLICGGWKSRERLQIGFYPLLEAEAMTIAEATSCGQLPCVKDLEIYNNGGFMHTLMSTKWQPLQRLTLAYCSLEDSVALHEANIRGCLPSLQYLKYGYSAGKISSQLSPLLNSRWEALQEVDLSSVKVTVEAIRGISEASSKGFLPSLKRLKLQFDESVSDHLSLLFTHPWPALEELQLQYGNLICRDAEAVGLANQLQYLPSLKRLDLYVFPNLSGQGLISLLSHKWPVLRDLSLKHCSLTPSDCDTFVDACREGRIPQLTLLNIGFNNKISGAGLTSLLSHRWPVLECLSLDDCSLTSADGDSLINACRQGRLPKLKNLEGITGYTNNVPYDKIREFFTVLSFSRN